MWIPYNVPAVAKEVPKKGEKESFWNEVKKKNVSSSQVNSKEEEMELRGRKTSEGLKKGASFSTGLPLKKGLSKEKHQGSVLARRKPRS